MHVDNIPHALLHSGLAIDGAADAAVPDGQSSAPQSSAFVDAVNAGGGPAPDHTEAAEAPDENEQEAVLTDSQVVAMATAAARNTTETSGACGCMHVRHADTLACGHAVCV